MKLLKKINSSFKKQGGFKLIKQYKSAGVLLYAIMLFPFLCFSRTGLELFRNTISERIHRKLIKKYKDKKIDIKFSPDNFTRKENLKNDKKIIWFLWLQGIEEAPEIVKNNFKILNSIIDGDRIILVTEKNIDDYITLPEFILNKWKSNIISNTHLSDIIRLELLLRYGGIWFDSTLMLTANQIPQYIEETDFFVPQTLKPGRDGKAVFISNWLIASKPQSNVIQRLLNLLYLYWDTNDELVDYFIFHHLLEIVFVELPNEYRKMIPVDNSQSHSVLISVIRDDLDLESIKKQLTITDFQKLSNKATKLQTEKIIAIQQIRLKEINV